MNKKMLSLDCVKAQKFFEKSSVGRSKVAQKEGRDYSPFGLELTNKQYTSGEEYRYGFNGKEKDNDISDGSLDFGARIYGSDIGRWFSVDPLADKYPDLNAYNFVGNNPLRFIDPDGKKFIDFDEDGNYIGITKDNWWHNFWHGNKGRIVKKRRNRKKNKVIRKFKFADPKHDVEDIQKGTITKLVVIDDENIIKGALIVAGAFNEENRKDPVDFLSREGIGGGSFDFSYRHIPNMFPGVSGISDNPLGKPSSVIFLVDNVAHNHMNFGNFLFGAGGATLGVHVLALKLGAHKNSRFPEDENGNRLGEDNLNDYKPQWDSNDDQRSIRLGWHYTKGGGLIRRALGLNKRDWANEKVKRKRYRKGKIEVGPVSIEGVEKDR